MLKILSRDTQLLDITYGLLQLELGMELLQNINVHNLNNNLSIQEKNNKIFELIREKWEGFDDDKKSSRTMQTKTIEIVKPCKEALQNWFNWSIIY